MSREGVQGPFEPKEKDMAVEGDTVGLYPVAKAAKVRFPGTTPTSVALPEGREMEELPSGATPPWLYG